MRKISVFYDGSHYIYRWLKPLFAARKEFKQHGYIIEYPIAIQYLPIIKKGERLNIEKMQHGKYDVVFLAFHHSTSYLCNCPESERANILGKIKNHCKMLVWLDTADSIGCGMFDVMPYVDLYLKKQLLKDKSIYTRNIYGARLFCEYYHNKLKIDDKQLNRIYPTLDAKYFNKLGVSWNVGMGDIFAKGYHLLLTPYKCTQPHLTSPDSPVKRLDLHFRGSGWSKIAGYQRSLCKELVNGLKDISHPDVNSKIPYKEYAAEIQSARMVISPFGWGEICTRDFEAFVNGATLIKPDMSHCETWPNVYIENKTYMPLDWDFNNFRAILDEYSVNPGKFQAIAKNGQELYMLYRSSKKAKDLFVKHILSFLER